MQNGVIKIPCSYIDKHKEYSHDCHIIEDRHRGTNKYRLSHWCILEGQTNPFLSLRFFHNILHTQFTLPKPFNKLPELHNRPVVLDTFSPSIIPFCPLSHLCMHIGRVLEIEVILRMVMSCLSTSQFCSFLVIPIFFKHDDATPAPHLFIVQFSIFVFLSREARCIMVIYHSGFLFSK